MTGEVKYFENIVDQKKWDDGYKTVNFKEANDLVARKMDDVLNGKVNPGNSCFEVGCFPCGYLVHIGRKFSLNINGVDRTDQINNRLYEWLNSLNVDVGSIVRCDAFDYIDHLKERGITYDVVYSLGFVEHFRNYKEVILYHDKILKPNGVLIISTPNFRGIIQYIMHYLTDRENLNDHVISSMNIDEWATVLQKEGYEILHQEYYGGFKFWSAPQERNFVEKFLEKIFLKLSKIFHKNIPNSQIYSPYGIVVAKKIKSS